MSNAVGTYVGRGPAPDLGDSRTTAEVTWSGVILTWADLPGDVQAANAGGSPVAEGVHAVTGARRFDGVPHQVRLAWRAWDNLIVVVTVTRPLRRRDDGKLAPSGPWAGRGSDEYQATGPARHTRSTLPAGAPTQAPPADGPATALARDQASGADAFAFLPSPVRGALVKEVPDPRVWLGELSQLTTAGQRQVEEAVVMCRIGAVTAVVLTASRTGLPLSLPLTDWRIDRHTFSLAPSRQVIDVGPRDDSHRIGR